MMIPVSADELLEGEQQMVVEFRYRKAKRAKELKPLLIETKITLRKNSRKIDFETTIDNQMKDHRLRALFPPKLHVEHHEADIYLKSLRDQIKFPQAGKIQRIRNINMHLLIFMMKIMVSQLETMA